MRLPLLSAFSLLPGLLFAGTLAGCPRSKPAPVVEARSLQVELASDIVGASGVDATITGTLARHTPEGIPTEGTAIVLRDGTAIFVTEGDPPAEWEWMLDMTIRVQGLLWEKSPTGWPVAKLEQYDTPMPAGAMIGFDVEE